MSRPPYGSHSGCRHACQKRPTSQCGWTRRAAAQTVVAQRVPGRAGNALLRDRGNESLRRRLSEGAPPRGAHAGDGFIVGGSCSRADRGLGSALLVAKSGGKEVSHIEKNNDLQDAGEDALVQQERVARDYAQRRFIQRRQPGRQRRACARRRLCESGRHACCRTTQGSPERAGCRSARRPWNRG